MFDEDLWLGVINSLEKRRKKAVQDVANSYVRAKLFRQHFFYGGTALQYCGTAYDCKADLVGGNDEGFKYTLDLW